MVRVSDEQIFIFLVPTGINKQLSNMEVLLGQDFELDCELTGHPLPAAKWYFYN